MEQKNSINKTFTKIIKKRGFWFVAIVYPLIGVINFVIKGNQTFHEIINEYGAWYFFTFLIISVLFVYIFLKEVIEKRLFHKIQGDKLKLKRKEKEWR